MDLDISATRRARKMFFACSLKVLALLYTGNSITQRAGERIKMWEFPRRTNYTEGRVVERVRIYKSPTKHVGDLTGLYM